ncbi:MAG: proton-conducting transporter membrane subunit [Candidatus Promineifilaceae bacterium]|nr:proton-conducting transporter membrane subunit [Candidatus Promineifilaceae bacterium]
MPDLLFLLSAALLIIGAGVAGVTYRQNRRVGWLTAAFTGALAAALVGGARLAGTAPARLFARETPTEAMPADGALALSGYVDGAAWQVSVAILFLVVAVSLYRAAGAEASADRAGPGLYLLLLLSALSVLWAATLQTLIIAWTLFILLWSLFLFRPARAAGLYRLGGGWLSLFLLWLGAATLAIVSPAVAHAAGWGTGSWPLLTRSLLLAAALLQLGVYPLHLWRPLNPRLNREFSPTAAALVHTLPAAGGALLLARLVADSAVARDFALPLTLIALLTLLVAAAQMWRRRSAQAIIALLVLAQSGIILLSAVWGDADATLAEARVLLLAGGLLFLVSGYSSAREPAPAGSSTTQLIMQSALLFAVATLAGFPPTAGFSGRAAVYSAWLDAGHWLLIVVTAVLHLALVAAALTTLHPLWSARATREGEAPPSSPPPSLPATTAAALLLPVLGLFSLAGLEALSLATVLAVALPLAGGAMLARLMADRPEALSDLTRVAGDALRLQVPRPPAAGIRPWPSIGDAVRQAATLLEGESGLLWLLLLLILTWLTFFSV